MPNPAVALYEVRTIRHYGVRLDVGEPPARIRQAMLDVLHEMASRDPKWVEQETAFTGMLREMATPALVDMRYHAYETVAIVDSYGAACIWIDRLERELTHRGFILDAETAFNAAYFELGVRQAREEANA